MVFGCIVVMSLANHYSLLNWIVKLDPQLIVKWQDVNVKVRPKPHHLSVVETSGLSEKSIIDFRDFLADANECLKQCTSFSSTIKQYSKLGVLQQEILNYPHLIRDEIVQFHFAGIFESYCNQSFSDPRSAKLARFWCYRNFKKMLIFNFTLPFRSNVASLRKRNKLMQNEEAFENHLCSLLESSTSITLLKMLLLFCNVIPDPVVTFINFTASLHRVILNQNLDIQRNLQRFSGVSILEFSMELRSEIFVEKLLELIPEDPSNLLSALQKIESSILDDPLNDTRVLLNAVFKVLNICTTELDAVALLCFNLFLRIVLPFVRKIMDGEFWAKVPADVTFYLFTVLPVDLYSFGLQESFLYFLNFLPDLANSPNGNMYQVFVQHWCFWFLDLMETNHGIGGLITQSKLDNMRSFVTQVLGGKASYDRHLQACFHVNVELGVTDRNDLNFLQQFHAQRILFRT